MPIPEHCTKEKYQYLCTYMHFLNLGFTPKKADKIALYAFGYYTKIYT